MFMLEGIHVVSDMDCFQADFDYVVCHVFFTINLCQTSFNIARFVCNAQCFNMSVLCSNILHND